MAGFLFRTADPISSLWGLVFQTSSIDVCMWGASCLGTVLIIQLFSGWPQDWNLHKDTKVWVFMCRHNDFMDFVSFEDYLFCSDVNSLMEAVVSTNQRSDIYLLIPQKLAWKLCLFTMGIVFISSLPLAHAPNMKEIYESMTFLQEKSHIGAVSNKHCEWSHQDISQMEKWY